MKRFVEEVDRGQSTLLPECLDHWINASNPVRVIDVLVEKLDLGALDFGGGDPKATGRPSFRPSVLLKLYVYGYMNRVQSSRRLEREAGRNVEVMWLTDVVFLITNDRRFPRQRPSYPPVTTKFCALPHHGPLRRSWRRDQRQQFKAVNNRDKNFTRAKMQRRIGQIEESVARYLPRLDSADRQEPSPWRARRSPLASKRSSQSWKKRCSG